MRQGGSAMPPSCFADISGKRDISQNDPSPKSSPSESHPVAHLYHSKAADGGSQIPKAKSHIPSRRRQRHERPRGKPVAKREMQQFQGILSSRVPRPPPQARPPKVTFYVCRAFKRLAQGSSFQAAEAVASGRANERRSKPIPTCTFLVRSLEVREVMCPFPPGLTGSGAERGP